MTNRKYHVGIAGNIGAGKTTLASMLSKHYGWNVHYESVDNHPYLQDFYDNMLQWSFHLQIYFLQSRLRQHQLIQAQEKTVVQDRTIYEDAEIFARNLVEMKLMTRRDFENYYQLYEQLVQIVRPPDLLIYLRSSVSSLVEHIQDRGRKFEQNIRLNYLKKLNEKYEDWISKYKNSAILIIDMSQGDYVKDKVFFQKVIRQINQSLGLRDK